MGAGHHLRFDHVSVLAEGAAVLDDVDLELGLDGVVAVVGPSGAGKTTLLRLCNRLEVPTAGRVLLDGRDLAGIDPVALRRRVGMIFQQPAVFAGTVEDNLAAAGPSALGCAEALARVGLPADLLARRADDLSGGEAQRVCLARALRTEPEVLLMDEPTAALDPRSREVVEDLALDLARGGTPSLWVTHDLDQARRLARHVVVLVEGRVVTGPVRDRFLRGEEPHA